MDSPTRELFEEIHSAVFDSVHRKKTRCEKNDRSEGPGTSGRAARLRASVPQGRDWGNALPQDYGNRRQRRGSRHRDRPELFGRVESDGHERPFQGF